MIPCQICTVVDQNTGATLSRGVQYPLVSGGIAEILWILVESGFLGRTAKVLVRISSPGAPDRQQWFPAIFDSSTGRVYMSFPVLSMESIIQYVWYPWYPWHFGRRRRDVHRDLYGGRRRPRLGGAPRDGGSLYGSRGGRRR